MFVDEYQGWPQDNSNTQAVFCAMCGKDTDHYVYVQPDGIQIGFFLLKRPIWGGKKFFLTCPGCKNRTKEIAKGEARRLRK